MKRLDYISRALSKIQHKKYELYVISRIIHKLDNPQIRYVFQQYATRNEETGKYALIDLYLPQLGIAIEVDEAHHKEQYTEDQLRQKEIERLDIEVKRITCYNTTIDKVNTEIDELVAKINDEINKLGDAFQPWEGLDGYDYYTKKGCFDINDKTELFSPTEICNCFGFVNPSEKGARKLDLEGNTIIWWPRENYQLNENDENSWLLQNSSWCNILSDDGKTITEYNKNLSKTEKETSCDEEIKKDRKRVVFYKKRNMLNDNLYQFVGVFEIDKDETHKQNKRVYKRTADTFKLPHQYTKEDIDKEFKDLDIKNIQQTPKNRYNAAQKIINNFETLNESLEVQSNAIDKMEKGMQQHIANNKYNDYLQKFDNKLKELKETKNKDSSSEQKTIDKEINAMKNGKLTVENIEKLKFLYKIRSVEGYNKIHYEIEDFKKKYL